MKTKLYSVIAFKPSSDSYSMGCHMQSYGENLTIFMNVSRETALQKIAELGSLKLDHSEEGYSFGIINGGYLFGDLINYRKYPELSLIPTDDEEEEYNKLEDEALEILNEAKSFYDKCVREREEQEKLAREKAEKQRRIAYEESRRNEYLRLKAEFENKKC